MITRRKKISQEIIRACKKNSESEESDGGEEQEEQDEDAIIIEAETDSENEELETAKVNKADKITSNVAYCKLIATLEPVHTPIQKSEGGFHYLFEAESPDKIDGTV